LLKILHKTLIGNGLVDEQASRIFGSSWQEIQHL
jgi:hypothetical protein